MKIIDIPRSGSAGSVTSSRNRAGQYTRNRRAPVQPIGSGRRAAIRSAFSAATQAWSALTDAQRSAWAGFADGYPYIDSLGQTIKLTGHQMYVACATQLLNCGGDLPSDPPASTEIQSAAGAAFNELNSAPSMEVTLPAGGVAEDFFILQLSPQMSAGRMFNGRWWQAAVIPANTLGAYTVTTYTAEFGALVAGKKVFGKLTPVNQYGLTGTPVIFSGIVVAP